MALGYHPRRRFKRRYTRRAPTRRNIGKKYPKRVIACHKTKRLAKKTMRRFVGVRLVHAFPASTGGRGLWCVVKAKRIKRRRR